VLDIIENTVLVGCAGLKGCYGLLRFCGGLLLWHCQAFGVDCYGQCYRQVTLHEDIMAEIPPWADIGKEV
jgi:hypothetical protein